MTKLKQYWWLVRCAHYLHKKAYWMTPAEASAMALEMHFIYAELYSPKEAVEEEMERWANMGEVT